MDRSPLHNLNLPPGLTWGSRRFLRCMNINPIRAMRAVDDDESSDSEEYNHNRSIQNRHAEVGELEMPPGGRSSDDRRRKRVRFNLKPLLLEPASSPLPEIGSIRKLISEGEDEISLTREKLLMDSPPVNSETVQNSEKQYQMPPPPPDAGEINAAVVNDPMSEKKSTRPRRNLEKKQERAKFSVPLSRKEIEDDSVAMTGKKPARKPNKRPRNIQNQIQGLFPGSRLCEVHPDLYR